MSNTLSSQLALVGGLPQAPTVTASSTHSTLSHMHPELPTASAKQSTKTIPVSSLMSPAEEPLLESFAQTPEQRPIAHQTNMASISKPKEREPQHPPSPPISPWTTASNQVNETTIVVHDVKDPVLYPTVALVSPSQPLFRSLRPEARKAVREHMQATLGERVVLPTREEYELTLSFKDQFMENFLKSPSEWLRRERAYLNQDAKARNAGRNLPAKSAHRSTIHPKPLMARPSNTIVARTDVIKSATGPRNPTKITKPSAARPVRAQTVKPARYRSSKSPSPPTRARPAPASKEDKDFHSIPDYCPPLSSLTPSKTLRVEWKNNSSSLDLSDDPLKHLLHPDELQIASCLRLDCATYLTSKRRIFLSRLEYYHRGKEFRKTHAQQACKIDVNKASKLHTAFEEVGWFRPEWVEKYPPPRTVN